MRSLCIRRVYCMCFVELTTCIERLPPEPDLVLPPSCNCLHDIRPCLAACCPRVFSKVADASVALPCVYSPMSREYSEFARLSGGHSSVITTIAMSSKGNYVATAAADNKVCIWEISSQKLLHEYSGSSYALCLAWIPAREDQILCGMLDGYVVLLSFDTVRMQQFTASSYD